MAQRLRGKTESCSTPSIIPKAHPPLPQCLTLSSNSCPHQCWAREEKAQGRKGYLEEKSWANTLPAATKNWWERPSGEEQAGPIWKINPSFPSRCPPPNVLYSQDPMSSPSLASWLPAGSLPNPKAPWCFQGNCALGTEEVIPPLTSTISLIMCVEWMDKWTNDWMNGYMSSYVLLAEARWNHC